MGMSSSVVDTELAVPAVGCLLLPGAVVVTAMSACPEHVSIDR